ncbi:MAG: MBL fold metallo-hydrolase [Flavobacteriaceae bacterium]|nr:MBL fold metallo-hydrolase [Flavobacteriaceae bacterium]
MQYEIDFLPVGDGESGGDAITIRYGDFSNPQKQYVVVIDGGTKESGKKIVEHIEKYYGTTYVDLVIATHLHQDHTSGLTEVLENLQVGKLAMHLPWSYTEEIKKMTKTESTTKRLETKLEKSISTISTLEDLATEKNIEIIEPFCGDTLLDDNFLVLNPSENYYTDLLVNFKSTPEVKKEHSLVDDITTFAKSAFEWIEESLDIETLSDDYEDTSPENNSSLILLFKIDEKRFLFTGDAGKEAINKTIEYSEEIEEDLKNLYFLDVPHHGSKRNLGPSILDYLKPQRAYISCPKEGDPKHPSRKVKNALIRRDCRVFTTQGSSLSLNATRDGWVSATPEKFSDKVES